MIGVKIDDVLYVRQQINDFAAWATEEIMCNSGVARILPEEYVEVFTHLKNHTSFKHIYPLLLIE